MQFSHKKNINREGKSLTHMLRFKGNAKKAGNLMEERVKLDETDIKILKFLFAESRTSFTEIAKNCGISVGAVRMRYKRLWKTGVINGEILQVNPHSLGYRCISEIGIITAAENEKKVKEFLESKPYTSLVRGAFGKYNLSTTVALRSVQELSRIQEDLQSNPLINQLDSLIWTGAINVDHTENLEVKPTNGETQLRFNQRATPGKVEEAKIDETDRKIARMLTNNSRMSFRRIAQQLGISTKNVIQRYKKLRKNVLPFSTITVDLQKLGYKAMAHLFIRAKNKSKIPEIYGQIIQIPNLIVTIKYIGHYDMFAVVALSDFEEMFKLKDQLHRINHIEKTDTFIEPMFHAWPLNIFACLL